MKTGTPPRLDGRTIDYSVTEEQAGDENTVSFSYMTKEKIKRSTFLFYNLHFPRSTCDIKRRI